jgi:UDP-glucose 4-epimerase
MEIKNKKVLVVGGAGFVGSNLVLELLRHEPAQILIVDNLISSDRRNVPLDGKVFFICGSIADDLVLSNLPDDLDYVFHLACFHGNQSSIQNPLADHDNNTITSLKLFNHLSQHCKQLQKVVYAAAGCAVAEKTYGEAKPTTEDAPVSLFHDSPYSISKLIGELYGNYFFERYKLPFVKARFQNVYGPREILGAGNWRGTVHSVWRNVTPTFIWKSLHGEALTLDNQGQSTRDFIFVEDMARGLVACALNGEPGGVYNLASGVETSIMTLAKTINEITGNKTELVLKGARDWDKSGRRFGSTEKSKEKLSFQSQVNIREGLEKTIAWTKTNEALIAECMRKHDYFMKKV